MIPPDEKFKARPSVTDRRFVVPRLRALKLCAIGEKKKVSKSMVIRLAAALLLDSEGQEGKVTLELH